MKKPKKLRIPQRIIQVQAAFTAVVSKMMLHLGPIYIGEWNGMEFHFDDPRASFDPFLCSANLITVDGKPVQARATVVLSRDTYGYITAGDAWLRIKGVEYTYHSSFHHWRKIGADTTSVAPLPPSSTPILQGGELPPRKIKFIPFK
jgi:hypothetical protein